MSVSQQLDLRVDWVPVVAYAQPQGACTPSARLWKNLKQFTCCSSSKAMAVRNLPVDLLKTLHASALLEVDSFYDSLQSLLVPRTWATTLAWHC